MVYKPDPEHEPDKRKTKRKAYIPDGPLRLLAHMIADNILLESRIHTSLHRMGPNFQQENNADEIQSQKGKKRDYKSEDVNEWLKHTLNQKK